MTEAMLSEPNPLHLKGELDDLIKEQAGGGWDFKEGDKQAHDTWVSSRVKRCIELTALLRRTNTGPAKAGGRGKRAKVESGPPVSLLD